MEELETSFVVVDGVVVPESALLWLHEPLPDSRGTDRRAGCSGADRGMGPSRVWAAGSTKVFVDFYATLRRRDASKYVCEVVAWPVGA